MTESLIYVHRDLSWWHYKHHKWLLCNIHNDIQYFIHLLCIAVDQLLAQKEQINRQSWMTGFWKIRSKHRISLFDDFTSFTVIISNEERAPIYWPTKTDNYLFKAPEYNDEERPCDHPNQWVVQPLFGFSDWVNLHLKHCGCIYLPYI